MFVFVCVCVCVCVPTAICTDLAKHILQTNLICGTLNLRQGLHKWCTHARAGSTVFHFARSVQSAVPTVVCRSVVHEQ